MDRRHGMGMPGVPRQNGGGTSIFRVSTANCKFCDSRLLRIAFFCVTLRLETKRVVTTLHNHDISHQQP